MSEIVHYRPGPSPYTRGVLTVRNARAAVNLGKQAGNYIRNSLMKSAPNSTPIKTQHQTKLVKKAAGRGYKRVHKDVIGNKHAKKAIQQVVKQELHRELELKRTTPNYVDISGGISHRVWYVSDIASQLMQGDTIAQYSGDKVHLSSVRVNGWIHEQLGVVRGLPTRLEFYLIERKGDFSGKTTPTWGGGMWSLIPEDQFVKADTAADNSVAGRFAKMAPQKRRFRVLGSKTIYPKANTKGPLGTTDAPARPTTVDFTMKIDKHVKPFGLMEGEEIYDLPRVYLVMRAFQSEFQQYGSIVAASGQLQTQLFFRDA